jgi:DNA-binding transcriptional ArsR family regulator
VTQSAVAAGRWQLYRLLAEPARLRLLALAATEELSVGELADLTGESQPNVSRHLGPLRQAGLLDDRREGARVLVRLAADAGEDPVVADALEAGRKLCQSEGLLERVSDVLRAREAGSRAFFARPGAADEPLGAIGELPAYMFALRTLVSARDLAVDAGTGTGIMLDLLAPLFRRVVAVDRSAAQLACAAERVKLRGYSNVELLEGELDGLELRRALGAGADLVCSARVLHHAPRPRQALRTLAELARPGGHVVILDYRAHGDERWRDAQADVWMGFAPAELAGFASAADLVDVEVSAVPAGYVGHAVDGHLDWLALVGRRSPKSIADPGSLPG